MAETECLELEQEGFLQLQNEECIHLEEEVPAEICECLPCDVCIVNYCPVPVCVRPEVEEGVNLVSLNEYNCVGTTKQSFLFKYPGIRVFNGETSDIFNGSKDAPITLPLKESDKIIFPIIQDARGHLKHYRPAPAKGSYKLVSKDGSMRATPDVFPSLASRDEIEILPPGVKPSFFLSASASQLICSEGPTTIQLLKFSPPPTLPPIILPI